MLASGLVRHDEVNQLSLTRLTEVIAAYKERLFHEVAAPALRVSFANINDEDAAKIVAGTHESKPVREKALKMLLRELMPEHMLDDDEVGPKRAPVLPLPGISASAARGIVEAVNAGLVKHANWMRIYGRFEQIRVAAGDREP